jgi:hypothetical protein
LLLFFSSHIFTSRLLQEILTTRFWTIKSMSLDNLCSPNSQRRNLIRLEINSEVVVTIPLPFLMLLLHPFPRLADLNEGGVHRGGYGLIAFS